MMNEENQKAENNLDSIKAEDSSKRVADPEKSAALYTLWFGLDYGSILTAFALYKTVESLGYKSYLLRKDPKLWTAHYDEKDNIAGKFIYKNCDVLDGFGNENDRNFLDKIPVHIVGSDVMWDWNVVGEATGTYFYLGDVKRKEARKVAYGTSLGGGLDMPMDERQTFALCLREMNGISVKSYDESFALSDTFGIQPEIVLDPVFLCGEDVYRTLAEDSVAKRVEKESSFVFSYIKNGDKRKRNFLLRGYEILLARGNYPLKNFVDINRYPESKEALGLTPTYHILVGDWLYYLIHSDFVVTDDYYGMCFAILFQKDFVVVCGRDMRDLSRFTTLLDQLNLTERLVYLDDDFKTKEYLFRKPVRYKNVMKYVERIKEESAEWLKSALGLTSKISEMGSLSQ